MAGSKARVPPRWFVVTVWHVHRWLVRASGGRMGLWAPRPGKWGALRLTTRGRHSGERRRVMVGYYLEGYAAQRPRETAVVVLEPRPTAD